MLTLFVLLAQASLAAKPVAVGPLSGVPPAAWVAEKPANLLRSHQFKLPSGDESRPAAELAVYPESTPKFGAKFAEWRATVTPKVGVDPDTAIATSRQALPGGAVAYRLDASGTWSYRERPRDPKSRTELREDSRVIWLIVVHGDGATHVRLSGPAAVVAEHLPAFDSWVKALK